MEWTKWRHELTKPIVPHGGRTRSPLTPPHRVGVLFLSISDPAVVLWRLIYPPVVNYIETFVI